MEQEMKIEILLKIYPTSETKSLIIELPENGGFVKACDGIHVRKMLDCPDDSGVEVPLDHPSRNFTTSS
jgi:hypothetical protein